MWLTAYFEEGAAAKTGLSPTVTVIDLSDDSTVISAQTMTEVGSGHYKYDATSALSESGDYVGQVDAGVDTVDNRYLELDFTAFGIIENQSDLDTILADTGELQTDLADGGRLDLLVDGIKAKTDNLKDAWNDISQADANVACDAALTDYDPPTKTEMVSGFAGLNDLSITNVRNAVIADGDGTEINAAALNTLSSHDPGAAIAAQSDVTGLNDPTAATIADAVWDEAIADHIAAGSFGEKNQKVVPSETVGDYKADVSNLDAAVSTRSSHDDPDPSGYIDIAISSRSNHAAADVWSVTTRTLTAFGFAVDLSTAAVQAIWDAALTALTTAGSIGKKLADWTVGQVTDNQDKAGYSISGTKSTLDALNDVSEAQVNAQADQALTDYDPPTKMEMDSAIAGLNNLSTSDILGSTVEGSVTLQQALRLVLAVLSGKSNGGGTTEITFRDIDDSKDRLVVTVDENGNRTAVGTRDGS